METYPRSQAEFDALFASEEACRAYLAALRWPDGFRCPRCGHDVAWRVTRGLLYMCARCQGQTSLTTGTIFQDTRQPLQRWFRVIWYITNQKTGVSALGLQRAMGFGSYHTAWNWLHKLRRAMVRPGRDRLSGTVQVDEAYFGRVRPGHVGRDAEGKLLILLAVEHDGVRPGRIRLSIATNPTPPELEHFIQTMVEPGSIIETDGWGGYAGVSRLGYIHRAVRQKAALGDDPLPQAHLVISLVKRWMLGTLQGSLHATHVAYYLDEFTFRFNRRTSQHRGKLFYRLMQQAVVTDPVCEADLHAKVRKK